MLNKSDFDCLMVDNFSFLVKNEGLDESPGLYLTKDYCGRNFLLRFGLDLVQMNFEIRIGKLVNGELCVNRNKGGYWANLMQFLKDSGYSYPPFKNDVNYLVDVSRYSYLFNVIGIETFSKEPNFFDHLK